MARKQRKVTREYTLLGLEVCGFQAAADAGINYEVKNLRHCAPDEKVFKFDSSLEMSCVCIYPDERAGDGYELSAHGYECQPGDFESTLDDYHVRDEDYQRKYRKVQGSEVPVYELPKGIGMLDRIRGTKDWRCWAWVSPQTVTDMLLLLTGVSPLYVALNEVKIGRQRWIDGLTLQTSNPAED